MARERPSTLIVSVARFSFVAKFGNTAVYAHTPLLNNLFAFPAAIQCSPGPLVSVIFPFTIYDLRFTIGRLTSKSSMSLLRPLRVTRQSKIVNRITPLHLPSLSGGNSSIIERPKCCKNSGVLPYKIGTSGCFHTSHFFDQPFA